jgi:hypothetical protein
MATLILAIAMALLPVPRRGCLQCPEKIGSNFKKFRIFVIL